MATWTARSRPALGALAVGVLLSATPLRGGPARADGTPALSFSLHSEPLATRDLEGLRSLATVHNVRVFEPYEEREARFEALELTTILDAIYSEGWREQEELLFTCKDGYQPTIPVQRVLDHRAWLAFDRDGPDGFSILKLESGSHRRVSLGPFYLIWENLEDTLVRQEGDYGWPYQLVGIDLIRTRDRFLRMMPPKDSTRDVQAGFAAYRIHCSRCHTMNGEGGSIGPELNGPVRSVEVRDREWLRRWIDDPSKIRADSRMPRLNPALPQREKVLSQILGYLEAMAGARGLDER